MTSTEDWQPAEGGCPCRKIRYRLERSPLVVHCCHCRWCQKESGSAFALNIMIETKFVTLLSDEQSEIVPTPSESGLGQKMARCSTCKFAVWSNYGDTPGDEFRFVRAGTLDDPSKAPPSVHIFTANKQPWVILNDNIPIKEEYYEKEEVWSKASLERLEEMRKA